MAKQREKNGSTSVPQFGAWGHKTGDNLNFSMVFSQARANKKQNRHNLAQHNLGNEQEILAKLQEVSPRKDSSTPVPQFGAGNQKTEGNPDYSKVSPKAHANKKPHRHDLTRRSLENEKELGKHQEKRPMSVPQFGVWDQKSGGSPDYAKVSPQARTEKKQHKHASARRKLGNEQELRKHNEASPRKTGWLSVPQFGEWDQKTPSETNYSVVFSQARANRKHHKSDLTYRSYDFEQDLLCREREQAARRKKNKFLTYLSCCLPV
ncbi:uncharacterized protein LOC107776907 isoform X2 [Nicotiana tabacum]|uniref:Uncharacterized protein LOC107776907 isoform X2 n=1 Tax=Nicotiana tabacum TaxID=4097 RepID=A0A1S3YJD2_TOBAC|nr:PREDICTED: uncharacterized protein LOC107776907 isoform X2 [Nicotiana tabacum]